MSHNLKTQITPCHTGYHVQLKHPRLGDVWINVTEKPVPYRIALKIEEEVKKWKQ